jgi:DNA-binding transcriptional ArsR family regulator
MGITKSTIYTDEQNQVAAYAKVLGHPARIAIIQELVERKSCVCGELVTEIGLAQATVSQHLKELKQAGIIHGEVEGTSVCYCIDSKKWNELKTIFSSLFGSLKKGKFKCC